MISYILERIYLMNTHILNIRIFLKAQIPKQSDINGEMERYNIFHVYMIIRYDLNGKKYLYDVINIKKETSNPPSC